MSFSSLIFAAIFVLSFFITIVWSQWPRDKDGKALPPEEVSKKLDEFGVPKNNNAVFLLLSIIALIAVILTHS